MGGGGLAGGGGAVSPGGGELEGGGERLGRKKDGESGDKSKVSGKIQGTYRALGA